MLDAMIAGDLEAAFTWSGYAASKAPVFNIFATVPFGLGPSDMASWMLEGDGSRIHRDAYDKLGVAGVPCGIQGPKGGGWFRGEVNTRGRLQGRAACATVKLAADVIARLGASPSRCRRANSSTSCSRARWTAARCRRRPWMRRWVSTSSACRTTCRAGSNPRRCSTS